MLVGTWSRRSAPLPGELMTSCLARNARANGTSPYRFLALFRQGDPAWERDFDRDPAALTRTRRGAGTPDWVADIACLMGLRREDVEQATLAPERRLLGGPDLAARGDTPLILSAGVHHRTRTRHGLQFCPSCLAEDMPHFRKAWRLGFVVACERHGCALADGCPHCDASIVPHRSTTRRLTDCHRCRESIIDGELDGGVAYASSYAVRLQAKLTDALGGAGGWSPWVGREPFDAVRTLLAISAAAPLRARLRSALGLSVMEPPSDRMRFEQARLVVRLPWLETVAAWMDDWPKSFRMGAHAAGLTRRTFARKRLPEALAAEVARLPAGITRDRSWTPVLDEPVLRRLRREAHQAARSLARP